jgi:uncharacterized protein (DUF58 family)
MTLATPARDGSRGRSRTPAQPGPGPTPEALLRALELSIARQIRGLVAGDYRARDLGGGTELAHVRVHVPERALTTWLVLDCSPSMQFGTADRRKADVAEGVSIAMAHLSSQRGNRLGVVTFGGAVDRTVPPRTGRSALPATLLDAELEGAADAADNGRSGARSNEVKPLPDEARTPEAALTFVVRGTPPGGQVVLVTDLRGPLDWLPQLGAVAQRHAVLVVEIRDPREDELPDVGDLTLVDAETGREVRVDTSSARLRARFAEAAVRDREHVAHELRRLRVRHVVLSTSGSWLRSLADQLRLQGMLP